MGLDKDLTAQQLWAIASDRQHLSYDLLDEIVDHPATYRALSDWAVDALGASDISGLGDPPAPEVEAASPKRGFRLPGLGRCEEQNASSPELIYNQSVPVGPAPATPVFDATASIMDPAVNPWLNVAPVFDPVPVPVPVDVKTGQVVPPQVVIGDPWFKRPAPMGVVIVLGVIQILIVLALAVVAMRPAPTPVPASTVTSVVTVSPTPSVTPSVVATKRSVKP